MAGEDAGRSRRRRVLSRVGAVAVVVAIAIGLVVVARHLDARAVLAALERARPLPIAIAAVLNFVNLACKAAFWTILVRSAARVPFDKTLRYTIVSAATSSFAPARAGDALRVLLLRREFGVPLGFLGTVVALEKIADVGALLLVAAPIPLVLASIPAWATGALRLLSAVALVAVGLAAALLRLDRVRAWLGVPQGAPGALPLGFVAALGAWLTEMAEVALVLYAVGVPVSWGSCALVLLSVNLAITVPSPGHFGTLEAGAIAALDALGVGMERATAFALLYHAMQIVPLLAVGLALGRGTAKSSVSA